MFRKERLRMRRSVLYFLGMVFLTTLVLWIGLYFTGYNLAVFLLSACAVLTLAYWLSLRIRYSSRPELYWLPALALVLAALVTGVFNCGDSCGKLYALVPLCVVVGLFLFLAAKTYEP